MNNVPFTKASQKDTIKVTVSLKKLAPFFQSGSNYGAITNLVVGTILLVKIFGNREIAFRVNRAGSTAATNSWPLRQPIVGRPVEYAVDSVTVANEE